MESQSLKTVQYITRIFERVSPALAGWWVSRLFFTPPMKVKRQLVVDNLKLRWHSFTDSNGKQSSCRIYTAGEGDTVMLVHGWGGNASCYSQMAEVLLRSGFRIILFDFPGHGDSPGSRTNLVELIQIIRQLVLNEERVIALVGHSFGAVAAGYAIKSGLPTNYLISISAPVDMDYIVDTFSSMVNASEITKNRLIENIEAILGESYTNASLIENPRLNELSGLIIHDKKDRVVPHAHAGRLSDAWQRADVLNTSGLGHSRILCDSEVIDQIARHLKESLGD